MVVPNSQQQPAIKLFNQAFEFCVLVLVCLKLSEFNHRTDFQL